MRILVPGATGMVGGHLVEQALARGHEVVAIARNPAKLIIEHPRLTKSPGDILDAASVEPLLEGVDAVVSTVGIGTSKQPTTLYSEGTRNLLAGMGKHGVERIVVISSEVAEHWAHQGLFKLWVVLPLLQKFIGATYDDMRRMDVVLWESDAQWTAIRSPRIRSARAKGQYRLDTDKPLPRGWSIAAPDMATALLDIAERDDLGRTHVYIAN
ncbi:NAD-dependent epimerase/dehydratase family protein [Kocuria coralli]|uniref:NAD-dependent epimerase/dehydratase family protein n=1 Tax=Kocuria coralli TaxID=1461025 RepID=A0A5J5KYH3_9MICC|nr:NAD(P)H-binding protein [Kocuria coralli]KAA9394572.1 NAD-dependent epimerase/dehydratase family protein [Kocuria coralli]